jgi:hypothetical protein
MPSGEVYKTEFLNKYTQPLIITFSVIWAAGEGGGVPFFYIYLKSPWGLLAPCNKTS